MLRLPMMQINWQTLYPDKAMKAASKLSLSELKVLVEKGEKSAFILTDYHCIAAGNRPGHEVYRKMLYSSKNYNGLEFIVEHDRLGVGYTDYGWEVILQCPYIRCRAISGPHKYGNFRSEKAAVNAARDLVKKIEQRKCSALRKSFYAYTVARDSTLETFSAFLDSLNDEWEKIRGTRLSPVLS